MESFDVLSRTVNVWGVHFLEASAGTGKTFSIEHLFIRLLIEGEVPATIDQILVVTFTKAATREIRNRLRNALLSSIEQMEGERSLDYLCALSDTQEALRRLQQALARFEEAQIFTLHGFCYRMLSLFPLESGVSSSLEQSSSTAVAKRVAIDFLRDAVVHQEYSPHQVRAVLKKYRMDGERLANKLAQLMAQDKKILCQESLKESWQQWSLKVKECPPLDAKKWIEDYEKLSSCYKQMGSASFRVQAERLGSLLENKKTDSEEWEWWLGQSPLFLEKMEPGNLKMRAKLPQDLHYPGYVDLAREALCPSLQRAMHPHQVLLRMARDCQLLYKAVVEETLLPDHILQRMHQLLSHEEFVQKVRHQYVAVIIDEFQDTDPLQWEIFQKLFLHHAKAFCLVGDPKQSIYSFRSADIYTYLLALQTVGEDRRRWLDTNFRSSPLLVAALNSLLAEGTWMDLPRMETHVKIPSVRAGKQNAPEGSLQVCVVEASLSSHTKAQEVEESYFFPFLAQEIMRICPLGEWDRFAILVKDRYQAARLLHFLQERKIPAYVRRTGFLQDTPTFYLLVDLLEAIFSSGLGNVKKFLAGPLIGCPALDLEKEAFTSLVLLRTWKYLLETKGWISFYHAFMASHWGSRVYSPHFRQLSEIILAEEEVLLGKEILRFFQRARKLVQEEDVIWKERPKEEERSVTIMTLHMSKGLEFDVVFPLALAFRSPLPDEITLQEGGKNVLTSMDWSDPQAIRAIAEIDAEKMRQFYVALTRAKTHLYLPLVIDSSEISSGEASPSELFFLKQVGSLSYAAVEQFLQGKPGIHTFLLQKSQLSPPPFLDIPEEPSPPSLDLIPQNTLSWLSFTSLTGGTSSGISRPHEQGPSLTLHTMPLGTQTGIVLHRILENILQRGWHYPLQPSKILDWVCKEMKGPLAPWAEVVASGILRLLQLPLVGSQETFSLQEISPSDMMQEMEFLYPTNEGWMKGVIDLVIHRKGRYYLLDWKSNFLGKTDQDYSQENLWESMKEHQYDLQATLYTEALRRYVKLFDTRSFEESFGGVFYLFIRGNAYVYF